MVPFLRFLSYNGCDKLGAPEKRFQNRCLEDRKNRKLTIKITFMEVRIMLVSAKEMLQKAKAGHYAVGQFNINNLVWTKAILATAQ